MSTERSILPVDIVLGPSWWNKHAGITFDEDFFYHPAKRVESERKMEHVLYERWGEWCSQNLDDVVDDFEDHHFLEFYGTQPSGGAGDLWYSQYDPANYPVHTLEAPTGVCGTYEWTTGLGENYLLFESIVLNCSVGDIKEDEINVTDYDSQRLSLQGMVTSASSFSGNFVHSTGIEVSSLTNDPSNIVFWGLSNELEMISDHTSNYLVLQAKQDSGLTINIIERFLGFTYTTSSTYAYAVDTPYYLIIQRNGATLTVKVYSKKRRWDEDLL